MSSHRLAQRLAAAALFTTLLAEGVQSQIILEPRVIREETATLEDGVLSIVPDAPGLSGLPSPAVEFLAPEPVDHTPDNVIELVLKCEKPVFLTLTAYSTDTAGEVWPVRAVEPSDSPQTIRWSLDSRVGSAGSPVLFQVGAASEADDAGLRIEHAFVERAENLEDRNILAASSYTSLSLACHELGREHGSQEVTVAVPRAIARRSTGSRVVTALNGEPVNEVVIETPDSGSRALWQHTLRIPATSLPDGTHTVEAAIVHANGRSVPLGTRVFTKTTEDYPWHQWEYPHQSIDDYEIFMDGPDIRIVSIVRDMYSIDEPEGAWTMTHEIRDTTVTMDLSLSSDRVAWRTPAHGLWAAGGFHTCGIGDFKAALAMYVSGRSPEGVEVLGHLSTIAWSDMTPSIKNPVWGPADIRTGWAEGMQRALRPITITSYGRGFLLLAMTQVNDDPQKLMAAVSNELMTWSDAGVVPISLPASGRHLDVDHREGVHYLYTDDPTTVRVSRDPLREWETRTISFPEDWFRFRVVVLDDEDYLFGLTTVHGRNVLRWQPIGWLENTEDLPLPTLDSPDAS